MNMERRGVLVVAVWRRDAFCVSRSSLNASQQALLYSKNA